MFNTYNACDLSYLQIMPLKTMLGISDKYHYQFSLKIFFFNSVYIVTYLPHAILPSGLVPFFSIDTAVLNFCGIGTFGLTSLVYSAVSIKDISVIR